MADLRFENSIYYNTIQFLLIYNRSGAMLEICIARAQLKVTTFYEIFVSLF